MDGAPARSESASDHNNLHLSLIHILWDEFFQPNPGDGPDPTDLATYIANVRDKILRYRNHPSIVLWCARNEGYPPPEIDAALRKILAELEPTRRYQPSSTDGAGVRSHGPYFWRTPREFYTVTDDYFKTETGSMSVPTLESIDVYKRQGLRSSSSSKSSG